MGNEITPENIRMAVGENLFGVFVVHTREEVDITLSTLRDMGYNYKLAYFYDKPGTTGVQIQYSYDPGTSLRDN